jgi:steroid 5-alpha reductase family enzyme
MFSTFTVAFLGLAVSAALAFCTWLASVRQHDVSLVDRTWGPMIALPAVVYAALLPTPVPARVTAVLALALAWAVRLAVHVTVRNWGHGEDRRYQEIRKRNQPNFSMKSLYLVFALQAVLAWVVSGPLYAAAIGSAALDWLDWLGMAVAGFGIVFETVADWQLTRFVNDPAHKGQVLDSGLWHYSRHPNYFGEVCTWWGLFLVALAATGAAGLWCIVSPVIMTFMLLKVSGVSLLEKDIGERRPKYKDYVDRTPAFIPWFPKAPKRSDDA